MPEPSSPWLTRAHNALVSVPPPRRHELEERLADACEQIHPRLADDVLCIVSDAIEALMLTIVSARTRT